MIMKLNKIFTIAIGVLAFTACSDDDDFNTAADVTVNMEQSTMTVNENGDMFFVPITVTGTSDGPIQVKVQVSENGSTPATADVNYLVTTQTINIGAGESVANVEIIPVDDRRQNADRTFTVSIVSASGAKVGQQSSCLITIKDNDATLYGRLQGKWSMEAFDGFTEGEIKMNVNVTGVGENETGYGQLLFINFDADGVQIAIQAYLMQLPDGTYVLQVPAGQIVASGFSYSSYVLDLQLGMINSAGTAIVYSDANSYCVINDDESEMEYTNHLVSRALAIADGGYLGSLGQWFYYYDVKWVRE